MFYGLGGNGCNTYFLAMFNAYGKVYIRAYSSVLCFVCWCGVVECKLFDNAMCDAWFRMCVKAFFTVLFKVHFKVRFKVHFKVHFKVRFQGIFMVRFYGQFMVNFIVNLIVMFWLWGHARVVRSPFVTSMPAFEITATSEAQKIEHAS